MTTTYFLLATCVAAREKKAATKLLIVNKKKKNIDHCYTVSQLTNAVFISQRHKIESSGFLTIDVLYKKTEEKETCKRIQLPQI